jgi:hypothetical protein
MGPLKPQVQEDPANTPHETSMPCLSRK